MKYYKLRGFSTYPWLERLQVSKHLCKVSTSQYVFDNDAQLTHGNDSCAHLLTVAMLERNLMRLFYNFHHPDRQYEDRYKRAIEAQRPAPWWGTPVQLYTALAATAILGVMLSRKSK